MDKKFIFVVEDDKAYGSVYKAKLEREGYEIVLSDVGGSVVDDIRKRKPDLLILDLMLPQKSGFEILSEIRADDQLKDLKVMVASNMSQEADKEKVGQLGVSDYIVKSDISVFELVERVKKALSS